MPLGYWVLEEACRQLAEWRSRGPDFANVSMSVNLSRKQLVAPDLVELDRADHEASTPSPRRT